MGSFSCLIHGVLLRICWRNPLNITAHLELLHCGPSIRTKVRTRAEAPATVTEFGHCEITERGEHTRVPRLGRERTELHRERRTNDSAEPIVRSDDDADFSTSVNQHGRELRHMRRTRKFERHINQDPAIEHADFTEGESAHEVGDIDRLQREPVTANGRFRLWTKREDRHHTPIFRSERDAMLGVECRRVTVAVRRMSHARRAPVALR